MQCDTAKTADLYRTDVSQALNFAFAIVIVGLIIALAMVFRAMRTKQSVIADLEERLAAATSTTEKLQVHTNELETSLNNERLQVENEKRRAESAEEALNEATARAKEAEDQACAIESKLRGELSDPTPLGALEALRISRLWQEHVPGPGEPLPVVTDDDVHAALIVLAEASREESGTTVDISWKMTEPVRSSTALELVRICEEVMAGARSADSLMIEVSSENDSITLSATTDPALPFSGQLREVLNSTGWLTKFEPGEVILSL